MRDRYNRSSGSAGTIIGLLTVLVIIVGMMAWIVPNFDRTGRDVVATVTRLETIPNGDNGRIYRAWTTIDRSQGSPQDSDDGVFNIGDDKTQSQASSTLYGSLQVGHTYRFHVIGRRYASAWRASKWPNIVQAEDLKP